MTGRSGGTAAPKHGPHPRLRVTYADWNEKADLRRRGTPYLRSPQLIERARGPRTGGRLYGTGYYDRGGGDRGLGRERPLHLRLRAELQRRGGRRGTGADDARGAASTV